VKVEVHALSNRGPRVKKAENVNLPKGIFLRGDIYWIRYGNGAGQTIRESTYGTDLKKAENLLTLRKAAVLEDKLPEIYSAKSKKRTFQDLADDYKANVSVKKRSYCTEKYNIDILAKAFGTLRLHKICKGTVEAIQTFVLEERMAKEPTANRYVAMFKNMMTRAYENKWINRAVLDDVRLAKNYSEVTPDVTPLTPEECTNLIRRSPQHIRLALVIGIYTGLRRKDILKMKWSDVNFGTGIISVHVSKTANTASELLHVQMSDTLRIFLETAEQISEYVVCKQDGTQFKTIKESWDKARKAIGKPKLRLPDLRHTFASLLVMNGTDIYVISKMLGHSSVEMSKRYAHLMPTHHSMEAKKLDTIVSISPNDIDDRVVFREDIEIKARKSLN
jgi:integrase